MAQSHLARAGLVRLLAGGHLDPMPMYVAYPQSRRVNAKLRVFIDWMVELMEATASAHLPTQPRHDSA